jgi:catechol 2,3-dioxygenase-like lactoylglutathione lyase family enzyme
VSAIDAQITFVYTSDLAESARFYEETLGLPLVLDQDCCRIYGVAGSAFLGICSREEAPRPDGVILTLVTSDVDGWYERLRSRGVVFEAPPAINPRFRIYHCFLRDPSGYLVEIQRFDDPRWEGTESR